MIGIEIVNSKKEKDSLGSYPYSPELAKLIKQECLKEGLILETGGRFNSVLRLLPPLIISKKDIDDIIEILKKVFTVVLSKKDGI